ncbi:hypothetical protein Bhyg_13712 [Pseudolycoriella hygida]|uniref:Uncharacterized protein n=1 Tax=Pseudolycoriella hygida TaxID=35572 RepID=A0A9Q0MQI0_9DIPT|nr:hypothetical protein Bhyg_13712 [Pseudolycoriella hygida]
MNLPKRRSGKSQPTTIVSPKSISVNSSKEVSPSTSQNSIALPISANADEH